MRKNKSSTFSVELMMVGGRGVEPLPARIEGRLRQAKKGQKDAEHKQNVDFRWSLSVCEYRRNSSLRGQPVVNTSGEVMGGRYRKATVDAVAFWFSIYSGQETDTALNGTILFLAQGQ
ncbi:MAG: hypothetical protein V1738_02950 [Patescibacteria group bacterium]